MAVLLSFSPDERLVLDVKALLTERYSGVEVISASGHLDRVALRVREEYGRLVAEAPDGIVTGGKTLRESFTFEGRISLWWLNEIFGKRSDLYPTFTRLCQIEVISEIVEQHHISECHLLSSDREFHEVVVSYCHQGGITFDDKKPIGAMDWTGSVSLLRVIVSSLVWLGQTAIETFAARLLGLGQQPYVETRKPLCVFHTIYPAAWRGTLSDRDEKYGDTPEEMRTLGLLQPVYACTFIADGGHQWVGPLRFLALYRWWKKQRQSQIAPVYLLDTVTSAMDILRVLKQVSLIWRYYRLERSAAFQAHWFYKGVSFFPLIRRELRYSMKRTPRYLLHAMRVRRFVERMSPAVFVYNLFEFGFGRAMAYGVKTAGKNTRLIAAQEGPIARRKLGSYHYPKELVKAPDHPEDFIRNLPFPDTLILEGQGALDVLKESGYPAEGLEVGGAPRVSSLAHIQRRSSIADVSRDVNVQQPKRVVLVAFGAHDAQAILATCAPVLERRRDYHFLFKLHPRGGLSPADVETRLGGYALIGTYTIETQNVYELLPKADAVVATYSSVAMEGAALGYPTVCLYLPDRVNATPLLDLDTSSVHFASNPDELVVALDDFISNDRRNDQGNRYPEEFFFHRLDEYSANRWATLISDDREPAHFQKSV